MRTLYEAEDGKIFFDFYSCEEYEFIMKHRNIKEIEFYDANKNRLYPDDNNLIESLEEISNKCMKLVIPTETALEDLMEYHDYGCFAEAYKDITSTGTWVWKDGRRYCDDGGFVPEGIKIKISNIEWDTDEDDDEDTINLPNGVVIEDPTREEYDEALGNSYNDSLCEYLSNKYGFCVFGFNADFC